jgi:hypothetical protein
MPTVRNRHREPGELLRGKSGLFADNAKAPHRSLANTVS